MPNPRLRLLLVIVASVCASARPHLQQGPKTAEAIEVMHCLKSGDLDWLGNSPMLENAKSVSMGLRHDRKSYEREDHIIVVIFEHRTRGDVFDLTREDRGNRRIYRIENNGEFSLEHKTIEWPGEILGGNWTHDYMERNIRRVMRGPRIRVQLEVLPRSFPQVTCTSYVSDL